MTALLPDAKAQVGPPAPGSEACGCCDGIDASTPQAHVNRHGLSAIAYRVGNHADFRASLLAGLSDSRFAPLDRLLTRDADDFTIGLVDAFACAADVLGFYQERIANESWLRTAGERVSLQEMARLIGYRLRPGVAAETVLAFALEPPRPPPAGATKDPGAFVTGIPEQVVLESGLKVQSIPGPGEKPQAFETVETIAARPEWNAIRPWLAKARVPALHDTGTWLQGVQTGLKPGDALLVVGAEFETDSSSNRWDFRILAAVTADVGHDRTYVAWKRGLGSLTPAMNPASSGVRVFALRQRASVFGHNAPMWRTLPWSFRNQYSPAHVDDGQWPDFLVSTAGSGHIDLDNAYASVVPGGYAVLAIGQYDYPGEPAPAGTYVELYRISQVADVSRDEFALAGKSTRLKLSGANYPLFADRVRGTRVFIQSEELALAAYPVEATVQGDEIPVAVAPDGLHAGRRIVVQGTALDGDPVVHEAVLAGSARADAEGTRLDIVPPLPKPLKRDTVVVAANVARARHGETVAQVLGSGDASLAHQRFELRQLPLTFRAAPTEIGAASELTVRVGGVEWKERPTLYGSAPGDRAFTVQTDEAGREWLRFGDGRHGARLPSGSNNLRASYRKGIGRDGNVRAETLTQPVTRPLGLKGVTNPAPAQGGTDPESVDQARESIPLTTRTLGRAVSLLDYEDFARASAGIAKAQAAVLRLGHGPVIGITVAGQDGASIPQNSPLWINLRDALLAHGDPRVELRLLGYQPGTFRLGMKVKCDPDYEPAPVIAAVEAALRDAFSFARRSLGQPVQQSEVVAVAHSVPGVLAVDLDLLYGGSAPYAQTLPSRQVRLLASRMHVGGSTAMPSELLILHPGPLQHLEAMP